MKSDNASLDSLHRRPVKTNSRLAQQARYYWLLQAESHLTRLLFGSILRGIAVMQSPTAGPGPE